MVKFVEHYRAPTVYFAGPHDGWRAVVAGVERSKERHGVDAYDAPDDAGFKYAGPESVGSWFEPNCMLGIREATFVFGYLKDVMDYETIGELAYARAIGMDIYLAVGPDVSDEALAALDFMIFKDAARAGDEGEAKALFEAAVQDIIKREKRKFFVIEDDEPEVEESAEKRHDLKTYSSTHPSQRRGEIAPANTTTLPERKDVMVKPLNIYMAGYAGYEARNSYYRGILPEGVTLHWSGASLEETAKRIRSADFIWASITYEEDDAELADVVMAAHLGRLMFLTLPQGLRESERNLPNVDRIIRVDSSEESRDALLKTIADIAEKTTD